MGRSFGGRGFGGGGVGGGGGGHYSGMSSGESFLIKLCCFLIALTSIKIYDNFSSLPPSVRESTHQRHAISFELAIGAVGYSTSEGKGFDLLTKKMEYFYSETGVIPYIYFFKAGSSYSSLNNPDSKYYYLESMPTKGEANELAENLYNTMFEDESHMLILYICGDGIYPYQEEQIWYYCGEDASTVIDIQACEIFLDYVELYRYENDNIIDNRVFANAFESTTQRIMGPPSYKWIARIIGIVFVSTLILVIMVFLLKKRKKHKHVTSPLIYKSLYK